MKDVLGNTVPGDGMILAHEHVQFGWPGAELDPAVPIPESCAAEAAVLDELADAGFMCFVDATPIGCQRDLARLAAIARTSRIHLVAATGLYHARSGFPTHFAGLSVEELADLYLCDIRGENPPGVYTGVIKIATNRPPFAKREVKALQAAAIASTTAEVPIVSHAESLEAANEQWRILREAGASPSRVMLGHLDAEWADPEGFVDLAAEGVFVSIDRCGHEAFAPDERRVALLVRLKDLGILNSVLLAHDAVYRFVSRDRAPASTNPFLHITNEIVPALRRASFSDDDIDALLRRNPARWLGIETQRS